VKEFKNLLNIQVTGFEVSKVFGFSHLVTSLWQNCV